MTPLAQFTTPPQGLSSSYFSPLILAALVYGGLFIAARVLEGREDPRSEQAEDIAFGVVLLSGVYVAILAVIALVSESQLIWELLRIVVITALFFLVLIVLLLLVFERGIGGLSRARNRSQPEAPPPDPAA